MSNLPSFKQFTDRVGTPFHFVRPSSEPVVLTLAEARPARGASTGASDQAGEAVRRFALLFRGPMEPSLSQQTYAVIHDKLGPMDLFIVPVGRTAEGLAYEAVFNLVAPLA